MAMRLATQADRDQLDAVATSMSDAGRAALTRRACGIDSDERDVTSFADIAPAVLRAQR